MYFGMKNYLKSTRNHTVSYKKKKKRKKIGEKDCMTLHIRGK
jgi:hypothetical protein